MTIRSAVSNPRRTSVVFVGQGSSHPARRVQGTPSVGCQEGDLSRGRYKQQSATADGSCHQPYAATGSRPLAATGVSATATTMIGARVPSSKSFHCMAKARGGSALGRGVAWRPSGGAPTSPEN